MHRYTQIRGVAPNPRNSRAKPQKRTRRHCENTLAPNPRNARDDIAFSQCRRVGFWGLARECFYNVVACVFGVWRTSFWGLVRRRVSAYIGAYLRTSTHNCVYRRISVHICAYLHILAHICVYRPISAHISAYRCISAHIGRIPKRARHPWPGGMRGCVSINEVCDDIVCL